MVSCCSMAIPGAGRFSRHGFKGRYAQKLQYNLNTARTYTASGFIEISGLDNLMQNATKNWLRRTFNKESMSNEERTALHRAKMNNFRGAGRNDFWNPSFETLWAPWAESVEYIDSRDPRAVFDPTYNTCSARRQVAIQDFSHAIPTLPVLQYMASKAPQGKIAEIGSGLGYWALLLQKLGADVVAVDDFSEMQDKRKPMITTTVQMDGAQFVKQGGADERALFLCWPHMKPWAVEPSDKDVFCLGEACLDLYKGNTVFFVGEKGGCTYDVEEWMENHKDVGWRLETEIEIPCWSGVHDSFMCFVKHEES